MNRISDVARTIGWAGMVSIASLLAAWTAIFFVLANDARMAILCSVLAFLLDVGDGFLARTLGTASEFGRVLDSLVDAVNYSVLAALVTSQVLIPGSVGFVVGFVILAFGILRLALFTTNGFDESDGKLFYRGVVTPHLTLAVALLYFVDRIVPIPEWLVASSLLVLAVAQLSTVRTRKTGVLVFWIPVSVAIAVGALVWL